MHLSRCQQLFPLKPLVSLHLTESTFLDYLARMVQAKWPGKKQRESLPARALVRRRPSITAVRAAVLPLALLVGIPRWPSCDERAGFGSDAFD